MEEMKTWAKVAEDTSETKNAHIEMNTKNCKWVKWKWLRWPLKKSLKAWALHIEGSCGEKSAMHDKMEKLL